MSDEILHLDPHALMESPWAIPASGPRNWSAFVQGIAEAGQRVPILVRFGRVIADGRARVRACRELGRSVDAIRLDPDPHADASTLTETIKILRDHYTLSQLAMFAARRVTAPPKAVVGMFKAAPGRTREAAAREVGLGLTAVRVALDLRRLAGPLVLDAVEGGKLTTHAAIQLVRAVPDFVEQRAAVQRVVEEQHQLLVRGGIGIVRGLGLGVVRASPRAPIGKRMTRSLDSLEAMVEALAYHLDDPHARRAAEFDRWARRLRSAGIKLVQLGHGGKSEGPHDDAA